MFAKLISRLFDKQNGLSKLQQDIMIELQRSEVTRQEVLRTVEGIRFKLDRPPVARLNGTTKDKAHLD